MEKIFQKYFAKDDFKKYFVNKSNSDNNDNNPLNFINDKNSQETEDLEDVRFYENLFSQLVEKPSEGRSDDDSNDHEKNLKIFGTQNPRHNKELIGDICQIDEIGTDFDKTVQGRKSASNPHKKQSFLDGYVKNIVAERGPNFFNASPNTNTGNIHNNNNNNNVNNTNNARKYDLKKLNDQIIQKFGK